MQNNRKNILVAGFDMIDDNMAFLQNGTIDFLICQKPEQQGYKNTMAMFNFLLTGKRPERIHYSPMDIVVSENCQPNKNSHPYQ